MTPRISRPPALLGTCAALLLALAVPARAQRWDTYTNANGLNSVTAVSGRTWCASDHGLHAFDPATGRFTRWAKSVGGLASNAISEVEVDGLGNTWFGTRDQGVSIYTAQGEWRHLTTFEGLPTNSVNCLQPSPIGMWVGTTGGLALFEGFNVIALWPDGVNPSPFVSNDIRGVAIVGDSTYVATGSAVYVTKTTEGVTWLRRDQGLVSLDVQSIASYAGEAWCVAGGDVYRGGQTGTWALAETGLGGASTRYLSVTAGGMFAGAANGVHRWDDASTWQTFGPAYPSNAWVSQDPSGGYWAGNGEGVWRWTGSTWNLYTSSGPGGNWIQGMQLKGSTLYVSTRDRGVARFDGTSWRTFSPLPGALPDTTLIGSAFVFGLLADRDGSMWAGCWGQGLTRLYDSSEPPSASQYYDINEPGFDNRNSWVWSSAVAPDGARWFGLDTAVLGVITPLGINRVALDDSRSNYSPQNGQAMSGPQIRSLAFAPGAGFELWVGYARFGVDVFTDPTLNVRSAHFEKATALTDGLLDSDVWAVEMNGDSVWIATAQGLSRYSRATRQRRESIGTPAPSTQGAVHPLSIDAEGGVWWATASGVFHRKPDRSVELFTAENSPLLSDDVHSVYADRATGDIWIGTVLGVNRYNPSAAPPGGVVTPSDRFGVFPNPAFISAAGTLIRAADLTGPFKGRVYDVRGHVVKDLLGNASTGLLWDATDNFGVRCSPGVYFFRVESGGVTRDSRVVLVR